MWAANLLQRYAAPGTTVLDMYGGNTATNTAVYYTHRRYCYTYLLGRDYDSGTSSPVPLQQGPGM